MSFTGSGRIVRSKDPDRFFIHWNDCEWLSELIFPCLEEELHPPPQPPRLTLAATKPKTDSSGARHPWPKHDSSVSTTFPGPPSVIGFALSCYEHNMQADVAFDRHLPGCICHSMCGNYLKGRWRGGYNMKSGLQFNKRIWKLDSGPDRILLNLLQPLDWHFEAYQSFCLD